MKLRPRRRPRQGPFKSWSDAYRRLGRKPNIDNLGLEEAGIELDEYGDITARTLRCRRAHRSAAGVVGRPFFASTGAAGRAVGAMFSTVGDYCSLDEGWGATGARTTRVARANPSVRWGRSTPEVVLRPSKKQADSMIRGPRG